MASSEVLGRGGLAMEVGAREVALGAPPANPAGAGDGPAVLSEDECRELLHRQSVGRIGFVVDGWPVVLPVNYTVDGADIVIRTDARTKLAAETHWPAPVVVEVDAPVTVYKSGWSVLAHGVATEVRDHDELARLRALPLEPWAAGVRDHWIRIRVVQTTGRRLAEQGRYPHSWR
jgi:nitroimidazol reductase NimA-like FMN-containing flavoprotein (pyridoxamine 5'-phosphate oxidase superfamily)